MAFIDTSPAIPVLYNVTHAVGTNCPNQQNDVWLVQFLLLSFYVSVQPWEARPKGRLKLHGFCDRATKNWINKFQIDLMLLNHSIYADGRVDRIRNTKNLKGHISNTRYTLAWLNWYVSRFHPQAFAITPSVVPLTNPKDVPLPSNDIVNPPPRKLEVLRLPGEY